MNPYLLIAGVVVSIGAVIWACDGSPRLRITLAALGVGIVLCDCALLFGWVR